MEWVSLYFTLPLLIFTELHLFSYGASFAQTTTDGQLANFGSETDNARGRFSFLMPNVTPFKPELYLCTAIKVDSSKNYYIISFEPNATMNTAHHMLLYGCERPGSYKALWNCGEMVRQDNEITASPCDGPSQILYAWARDAPKLELPDGVGFKVGLESRIKYLVLQVHYAVAREDTDNSGIFFEYTTKRLNKLASVILMGTAGRIEAHATEHMETACEIKEFKQIHPFAYRTHTHSLGKVVSGYRVRPNSHGVFNWTLLGKRDPLTPQMFYPVENNETIGYGDFIAARCTMESNRTRVTVVGSTKEDEMCNFYLMYYVENDEPLSMKYCFSQGPPVYYWADADAGFNSIPDAEASSL